MQSIQADLALVESLLEATSPVLTKEFGLSELISETKKLKGELPIFFDCKEGSLDSKALEEALKIFGDDISGLQVSAAEADVKPGQETALDKLISAVDTVKTILNTVKMLGLDKFLMPKPA